MLATVEVAGKVLPATLSGVLADTWGYAAVFWLALGSTLALLSILRPLGSYSAQWAHGPGVHEGPDEGNKHASFGSPTVLSVSQEEAKTK